MMKVTLNALAILWLGAAAAWSQGPVGEWDFTTEAEIISDLSGNGNDLLVEGCEWVTSKVGKALYIPPEGGSVWCDEPSDALRPTDALTIVAWVRPIETANYGFIVDQGRGWGEDNAGYRFLMFMTHVRFMLKADTIVNMTGGKILRGQWHQMAATYDGQEVVIFLDGQVARRRELSDLISYEDIEDKLKIGFGPNGNLAGEIASVKIYNRALSEQEVVADWEAGRGVCLTEAELAEAGFAALEKCSLAEVPQGPFVHDRHTTLLAHMDGMENCDADYSRWDGRAGGGEMNFETEGRFGSGVELLGEGAPVLYRGAANCSMEAGTCEFWIRAPEGENPWADDEDRYLLTIIPEWYVGYGDRPGLHLVLRTHAASHSLQLAANTQRIGWYGHLNGAHISDGAVSVLTMPLDVLAGEGWHHMLCSWSMEGDGRIWLLVDGQGVTTSLDPPPGPGPPIPCYKIFVGGSYFPDVYCPTSRAVFDELRITDVSVASRLVGYQPPELPAAQIDEELMMQGEDLCRHFLDFTAKLQMGGGWEGIYTWPNLMPDESPGSYAAAAEDEYTMRWIIPAYIRAYEVLGDDRYLRVAENCGQMLVKAQDENGAWCQGYIVMPDGFHLVTPGGGSIEEGTQTDPLRILFWLWRVTGRQEYYEAARKSAEFVLAARNPDGSWPLSFNSITMQPGGGYAGYSTLNDGTTLWGMKAMLMGWHLTGEEKYLDALYDAGQWLLNSFIDGAACGWAEQYSPDGKPAWARQFEPPAVCATAINYAAEALALMYDLTGDDKYLDPLGRCADWGRSLPAEHKGYLYYDPETGEPVSGVDYRMCRLSDPEFEKARYHRAGDFTSRLDRIVAARANGPLVPSIWGMVPRKEFAQQSITVERVIAQLENRKSAATKPLANLAAFSRGEFPAGAFLAIRSRHGRCFWPGFGAMDVQRVLEYIHYAKVVADEMKPETIARYNDSGGFSDCAYCGHIDPTRDWYNTPLGPTEEMASRGVKLRLHRNPPFIEMASEGEADFTLNVTNWSGQPLAGCLAVDQAPGFDITPQRREFDLTAGAMGNLEFTVRAAGAAPGYASIAFLLTYGDRTKRIANGVRIYETGKGLDSEQYQDRDLVRLSGVPEQYKLLSGDRVENTLTVANLTFEKLLVELAIDGLLPEGAEARVKPEKLELGPRESETVIVWLQASKECERTAAELKLAAHFDGHEQSATIAVEVFEAERATMVEAEAADMIAPPFEIGTDPAASGGKYIFHRRPPDFAPQPVPDDHETGGYADFKFRLPAAATVRVWIRAFWLDSAGNSFWISADGGLETIIGNDAGTDWHWVKGPVYALQASEHTVRIHNRETGSRLDKVLIAPAA